MIQISFKVLLDFKNFLRFNAAVVLSNIKFIFPLFRYMISYATPYKANTAIDFALPDGQEIREEQVHSYR